MTALVLGHLVLDEIHAWDGSVIHAAGGITFPLGTFDALADAEDRVIPVFPYGCDADEVMRETARRFPHVDLASCWQVEEENTRVRLFHESPSQYNTQLVRSLPSIPQDRYAGALEQADLVYLNFMTGDDIRLEDAAGLRDSGRTVFIDLHMIAYRVHPDGRREPAASEAWQHWLAAGDILQCNEREFAALTGETQMDADRVRALLRDSGARCFVLTRGEQGADIVPADGSAFHVPAVAPPAIVDPTGCGDAFGATFAWEYARGTALPVAAAKAARAAAFVVSLPGSQGIERLRHAVHGEAA